MCILKSRRLLTLWLLFLVPASMLFGGHAKASSKEEDLALRAKLESRITKITKSPRLHKQMIREGRDRTVLCWTCHGEDGMATQRLVPNLAGQNPVYIIDQFQRFADGRRNNFLMSNLSIILSDEDKIKIALYFSQMQMRPSGGGETLLLDEGKRIFHEACVECHGADGRGKDGYARLAGQRFDYVTKMLKEFRDRTGQRTNIWMTDVAIRLSDQDIEAVSTYLANLK